MNFSLSYTPVGAFSPSKCKAPTGSTTRMYLFSLRMWKLDNLSSDLEKPQETPHLLSWVMNYFCCSITCIASLLKPVGSCIKNRGKLKAKNKYKEDKISVKNDQVAPIAAGSYEVWTAISNVEW